MNVALVFTLAVSVVFTTVKGMLILLQFLSVVDSNYPSSERAAASSSFRRRI